MQQVCKCCGRTMEVSETAYTATCHFHLATPQNCENNMHKSMPCDKAVRFLLQSNKLNTCCTSIPKKVNGTGSGCSADMAWYICRTSERKHIPCNVPSHWTAPFQKMQITWLPCNLQNQKQNIIMKQMPRF